MARPLSPKARSKSLEAAQSVLADVGVEGFTVDEVARRSGVAKSTIYRHWSTRAELLVEAVDLLVVPFATPNTGSLRGDLTEFIASVLPFMEEDSTRKLCIGVMQASAGDEEFERIHEELMYERSQPMRTMLQLAQGRGEITLDLDLDIMLSLLEGPFFFQAMIKGEPLSPDAIQTFIDVIVTGLTETR